jgi:hypothetical protein
MTNKTVIINLSKILEGLGRLESGVMEYSNSRSFLAPSALHEKYS